MSTRNVLIVLALVASCGTAEAQVARVFVSVTGNDANVCSNIATPCRTFNGGIAQVDPNGEVIVISSGSYAGATIGKPVKINVAPGAVAFSGLTLTINVASSETVVLRGITLKAATPGTGTGIQLTSGNLIVEDSVVDGWNLGIVVDSAGKVFVSDTTVRSCVAAGVRVNGAAVVAIDNSRFVKNGLGLSPGYAGVDQTAGLLFVGGTEFTGAGYSGISVRNAAQSVIERSHFSHFQYGVISYDTAVVRLSHTTVVENVYGIFTDNTAFTETFGNNEIRGNNINFSGSGPVNPVALQ